jgi:hypothetical protein
MDFDKLILPPGVTTLSRGGKRRRHTRKFSRTRRHKKSNKSRTRRRHY